VAKTDLHSRPYQPTVWIFKYKKRKEYNYCESELDKVEGAPVYSIKVQGFGSSTKFIGMNDEKSINTMITWLKSRLTEINGNKEK
jgi:hypothetical protein